MRNDIKVESTSGGQVRLDMVGTYGDSMSKILTPREAYLLAVQLIGVASPNLSQLFHGPRVEANPDHQHVWQGGKCVAADGCPLHRDPAYGAPAE